MSRLAYFDCASGASGDMILGALVDLGLPVERLRKELSRLPLGGYRLEARGVTRCGLKATKVDVLVEEASPPHRHLGDVLGLIETSGLEAEVKKNASALFRRLGEAEAAVHGVGVEHVHFHELGAIDSLVDVVGGVIGLRWLGATRFAASALNVGTGSVTTSHGTFPVPAPATARLVSGVPVYGAGEGELLTPTGALVVTGHASEYGPLPPMRLEAVGCGAGSRELPDRPNVLRMLVGEAAEATGGETILVLETEVDDAAPQLLGPVLDRLLEAGALDAFFTPVQMKKGRPGVLVTVLAEPGRREALEEVLFRETTTLGVRRQEWQRTALERETHAVSTAYGEIRVKVGRRGGRIYNAQPEFEDCLRAAAERGVPVKEVLAAALAAWRGAGSR